MDLEALQRIKQWHVSHQREHPVEYHAWDAMLTLWLMGWVGWIPAFLRRCGHPLLALAMAAPTLYVAWRVKAHPAPALRLDHRPLTPRYWRGADIGGKARMAGAGIDVQSAPARA